MQQSCKKNLRLREPLKLFFEIKAQASKNRTKLIQLLFTEPLIFGPPSRDYFFSIWIYFIGRVTDLSRETGLLGSQNSKTKGLLLATVIEFIWWKYEPKEKRSLI